MEAGAGWRWRLGESMSTTRTTLTAAHTTVTLHDGPAAASWFFDADRHLHRVEVDGMIVAGQRDCREQLRQAIGSPAFDAAQRRALEIAERQPTKEPA